MSQDRIATLERQVSELMRNTAGIPVRWASGGGGGGSSSDLSSIYMIATELIDIATGDQDEIVATPGLAQGYTTAFDSMTSQFKRTKTGDPKLIYNFDVCQPYPTGTALWCAYNANLDMIEIICPACCTVPEGE